MPEDTLDLTIGEVAERTGLSVHALRFYEREDLLANPVRRGAAGWRVYSEDDVEWLRLCILLRASGMPLDAIRRYTALVRQGDGNEEERLTLLRQHEKQVVAQLDELHRCLDVIRYKVAKYEDYLADQS
jgi:DNA-binding transcriptional MerR regulator